jgi:hypothetical protein
MVLGGKFGSKKKTKYQGHVNYNNDNNNSVNELYRPRDRRLSAKLVPTFADRGMSRSERGGSPTAIISVPGTC